MTGPPDHDRPERTGISTVTGVPVRRGSRVAVTTPDGGGWKAPEDASAQAARAAWGYDYTSKPRSRT